MASSGRCTLWYPLSLAETEEDKAAEATYLWQPPPIYTLVLHILVLHAVLLNLLLCPGHKMPWRNFAPQEFFSGMFML